MPYSQDALTRIFNVHWEEEGLAVEFGDKDQGPFNPIPPSPAPTLAQRVK